YFFLSSHKLRSLHRNISRPQLGLLNLFLRKTLAYRGEFPCEILRCGVTLIWVFFQTPFNGPTQRSRRIGILHCYRLCFFAQNSHHRFRYRVSLESFLSTYHLVEHQAERELV